MTDRELLEAAADAAGIPNTGEIYPRGLKLVEGRTTTGTHLTMTRALSGWL
jgi:hypothetical protein